MKSRRFIGLLVDLNWLVYPHRLRWGVFFQLFPMFVLTFSVTNISRMKGLFALFSVFALLICLAMPNDCKAAVTCHFGDNDVGFCTTSSSHQVTMASTDFDFSLHVSPKVDLSQCPTATAHRIERGAKINEPYWHGGDSKASRCGLRGGNTRFLQVLICSAPLPTEFWRPCSAKA